MSIPSRDQLAARYFPQAPVQERQEARVQEPQQPAFVTHSESGRTVITAPVRETASLANEGFLYLVGRFVEADTPNRNGALWSSEDLQLAQTTVAGGPLNWLHDETHIVGTLLDGSFEQRAAASLGQAPVGPHIRSTAALWRFLFPRETEVVEKAALDARLYYSMECISKSVTCAANSATEGCGESFGYADYMTKKACAHLNTRQSAARFDSPVFLGGALIVPPVEPGWARADVEVVRQAASLTEEHHLADGALNREQAELMVERILTWANR